MKLCEFSPGDSLEQIQSEYYFRIYDILVNYGMSDERYVRWRNQFWRSMNDAFIFAMIAGWADFGGEGDIPPELIEYINNMIANEKKHIDGVFKNIKELRGDSMAIGAFATARALGYAGMIAGVYSIAKAFAYKSKDVEGTWGVGPTDHCETCLGLDGKKEKISWFLANGYIPQLKGNPALECRGFRCQCQVMDDAGNVLLP